MRFATYEERHTYALKRSVPAEEAAALAREHTESYPFLCAVHARVHPNPDETVAEMCLAKTATAEKKVYHSIEQCRKCGSHNLLETQKQTRSADEPMTEFFECQECNHKWSING